MNKIVLSTLAALTLTAGSALAADLPVKARPIVAPVPPAWDVAFGSYAANDYIFRGITQSNHRPSVGAYFEPRYNINPNLQLYAGVAGESISFANRAAAEVDFYGGIRPTIGPVAFDLGYFYYYYPGGQCFGGTDAACLPALPNNGNVAKSVASFYEVYAKASWTVNDQLAIGGNFYYSPNFLNTGADGEYASVTAKYTLPGVYGPWGVGAYLSGEFGRQWLGTSDPFYGLAPVFPNGVNYKDYNTWNVGVGFTYKVFTLDLRYSDTDLNKGDCNAFTSDFTASGTSNVTPINAGPGSRWCGPAFVAKLSADLTLNTNIK
jgi:uncharacterized protein (TIGR02001 family)